MPDKAVRLTLFLSHDTIKQASRPASSAYVSSDDAFNTLLKRLAAVEPAKLPPDNDN
jgi:hypothetical protein